MSSGPDKSRPGAAEASDGRLDSWKEIAAYLRRSVRSARRWEKEEALPVRRHVHGKGDSVYAYKTDLDGWWSARAANLGNPDDASAVTPVSPESIALPPGPDEPEPAERAPIVPKKSRTPVLLAVGLFVGLLLAAAWVSTRDSRSAPEHHVLAFQPRDWILVTGFENRSGQPLFDGTLDYALGRELSNSRYVNVVPRERVGDALRLMRRPLDSPIDAAVGREVCLRDGGIRALLTGRVEKLGSKYLLSVEIVEPKHWMKLAGFSEETSGVDGSLAAVRRISDRVRVALRETPSPEASDGELVKVTTSNLQALQLYSQADALMASHDGSQGAAEELLRQAVAKDPDFASAYIHLAYAIVNQGRPFEDFRPYAETAFRLAETTTDRERYFIRGSYYGFVGQPEKAIAAYEALLSLYPDHFWATNNLIFLYEALGQNDQGARFAARRADLRPKDFQRNSGAALRLAQVEPDLARTRLYVRRARELVSAEARRDFPDRTAWLELFPANELWLAGDAEGALAFATRFAEDLSSTPAQRRDPALVQLGNLFLTLGRLKTAEEFFNRLSDPTLELTGLALLRGDRQEVKRLSKALVAQSYDVHLNVGLLLSRSGLVDQAERVLAEWERNPADARPGMLEAARGELAMARGRTAEGIDELKKAQEQTRDVGGAVFLLGRETLASALARQGDLDGAIGVLELGSKQQRQVAFHWVSNGVLWERNQLLLARLYRKAGRAADAHRIEGDLLKLLAVADADHPILVELQRLSKVS